MPVNQTCRTNALAVELDLARHCLRYRVIAPADLTWQLLNQDQQAMLSNVSTNQCLWPCTPDRFPEADDIQHALGIQFGRGGALEWIVELVTPNGELVDVVKHCQYGHTGDPDHWYDSLRILVTDRPA